MFLDTKPRRGDQVKDLVATTVSLRVGSSVELGVTDSTSQNAQVLRLWFGLEPPVVHPEMKQKHETLPPLLSSKLVKVLLKIGGVPGMAEMSRRQRMHEVQTQKAATGTLMAHVSWCFRPFDTNLRHLAHLKTIDHMTQVDKLLGDE